MTCFSDQTLPEELLDWRDVGSRDLQPKLFTLRTSVEYEF